MNDDQNNNKTSPPSSPPTCLDGIAPSAPAGASTERKENEAPLITVPDKMGRTGINPVTGRPRRGGRPKGSKSATLIPDNIPRIGLAAAPRAEALSKAGDFDTIILAGWLDAFERLGGVAGLVAFGRKHPSNFYRDLNALLGRATLMRDARKAAPVSVTVQSFDDE